MPRLLSLMCPALALCVISKAVVVFRNHVSQHSQAVYAYAYRGTLPDTPQCADTLFAEQANGQCQSAINSEWVVFKEWMLS
ncbi:hypothetical protein [Alishewanella longhuensis]